MATSDRGFASMDEKRQKEIASMGGHAQGKENNPANFANDRKKAAAAGAKGGKNQPTAAKAKGGKNSHRGSDNT
ncbi:stress-induced protein [Candidatus Saccharibacteria bacterium]|nr:stress-induced protein [Candidatus Saccharibacteria bacterium]